MAIRVRALTDKEKETLETRSRSRTEEARVVERAKIVLLASGGLFVPAIAKELGLDEIWVRVWIKRFNVGGLDGLKDKSRSGRPPTYTPERVGEVVATSLTNPKSLPGFIGNPGGLPFASWTLDRLVAYLSEEKSNEMKRSRISEILIGEGLRWRQQETWFGERVDPEFAQKRGSSPSCIPLLPRRA